MGQSTEFVVMIHAIPYDKGVRARKTHKIGMMKALPCRRGLVEKDADPYRRGPPGAQVVPGEGQGAATVEDIVDDEDVPAPDVERGVTQQVHRA